MTAHPASCQPLADTVHMHCTDMVCGVMSRAGRGALGALHGLAGLPRDQLSYRHGERTQRGLLAGNRTGTAVNMGPWAVVFFVVAVQ